MVFGFRQRTTESSGARCPVLCPGSQCLYGRWAEFTLRHAAVGHVEADLAGITVLSADRVLCNRTRQRYGILVRVRGAASQVVQIAQRLNYIVFLLRTNCVQLCTDRRHPCANRDDGGGDDPPPGCTSSPGRLARTDDSPQTTPSGANSNRDNGQGTSSHDHECLPPLRSAMRHLRRLLQSFLHTFGEVE